MKEIRKLRPDEIDCRVGSCKEKGWSVLLYKNARVDMDLLDETYGSDNWQREHREIKGHLFCCVSIWNGSRWIIKEDVGIESNAEATKGEASDSFKRACVNVGIGRELYTAPFIWINENQGEIKTNGNRYNTYTKLFVNKISYDETGKINSLIIVDEKGKQRYSFGEPTDGFKNQPGEDPFIEYKLPDNQRQDFEKVWKSEKLSKEEKEDLTKKIKKLKSDEDGVLLLVEMEGIISGR